MISAEAVTKRYARFTAVDQVTFTAAASTVWVALPLVVTVITLLRSEVK